MADTLSKNNHPKLKWWQGWWSMGALIGLGLATITLYFVLLIAAGGDEPARSFGVLFLELPVLPIFLLICIFLQWLLLSFGTVALIFAHFISWILGGIVYAVIIGRIIDHFQKDKRYRLP